MDLDLYDESYDFFCKQIQKEQPQILDIGCGPGNISRYLQNKLPKSKITGIDIAPSMIEYAKKNVPTANFRIMDCRDIKSHNQKYDGISCGFCIPYLSKEDLITFINDSSHLFQDQVKIYLSFIEGNSTLSGFKTGSSGDRVYFHYHQKELILSTYAKHNIELLKQFDLDYKKGGVVTEVHTVLVLQKKE